MLNLEKTISQEDRTEIYDLGQPPQNELHLKDEKMMTASQKALDGGLRRSAKLPAIEHYSCRDFHQKLWPGEYSPFEW